MYFFGQRNLKIDIQHCFLQVYNDNMRKYTHNIKKFFTINFVELTTKKKEKKKNLKKKIGGTWLIKTKSFYRLEIIDSNLY